GLPDATQRGGVPAELLPEGEAPQGSTTLKPRGLGHNPFEGLNPVPGNLGGSQPKKYFDIKYVPIHHLSDLERVLWHTEVSGQGSYRVDRNGMMLRFPIVAVPVDSSLS